MIGVGLVGTVPVTLVGLVPEVVCPGVVYPVVVYSHGIHRSTGQQASVSTTARMKPSGHGHSPNGTHLSGLHWQAYEQQHSSYREVIKSS